MSIATIRSGLATRLLTVSGLRVESFYPDDIHPPMAIVDTYRIDYDNSFGAGSGGTGTDTVTFDLLLVVRRTSERTAQRDLDTLVPLVRTAINADKSLGGAAHGLRVTSMNGYAPLVSGETTYLAASLAVQVIAAT